MDYFLNTLDSVAAIITAAVAVLFYAGQQWTHRQQQNKLETYLRGRREAAAEGKQGEHSVLHLVAKLKLTEGELISAACRSKKIKLLRRKAPDTPLVSDL
ncbi:MAG: hypothetical protein ABL883_00395 [Terricaulis sp.]